MQGQCANSLYLEATERAIDFGFRCEKVGERQKYSITVNNSRGI